MSRSQAIDLGMAPAQIGREISGRRWRRSAHDGVYFVATGAVAYEAGCWAALLHAGPDAALGMETAAWYWKLLDQPPPVVHVMVPAGKRPARQTGVVFYIRVALPDRVHPARQPALVGVEDTVLDLLDRRSTTPEQAIDWVLRACQRRITSPARLAQAVGRRAKMRYRRLILDLVSEVHQGIQSALERRYVSQVERAHGLPRSTNNRPEGPAGRRRYRDVRYDPFALVVELDGRASHPEDERERDDVRDNELLEEEGARTLRYGWRSVAVRPCVTAGQVGSLLRQGGWNGRPIRCGPACELPPGTYKPGAPHTGNQRARSASTGRSAPTAPRTWSSKALSRRFPSSGANG